MSKRNKPTLTSRLGRFAIGLAGLIVFFLVIASGATPPGFTGEVLRHNRANNIDASPLFYSEVEHMAELEWGVRLMRQQAEKLSSGSEKYIN